MRLRSLALHFDVRPGLSATLNASLPIWNVPGASGGVKPVLMSSSRFPLMPVSNAISFTHSICFSVTRYVSLQRSPLRPGRPGERDVFHPAMASGWNAADTDRNATLPFGVSTNAAFVASCRFSPIPANGIPFSRIVLIVMKSASWLKSREWLLAHPQPLKPNARKSGRTDGSIELHVPPLHAAGRQVPSLTTVSKLTSRASPPPIHEVSLRSSSKPFGKP